MPSSKKKTGSFVSAQVAKKGSANKEPAPFWWKIATATLASGLVLWTLFFMGGSRHGQSPAEVERLLDNVLSKVHIEGEVIAFDTVDEGCSNDTSYGLLTRINCDLTGYKYFKVAGSNEDALKAVDEQLGSYGFKRIAGNERDTQVLGATREGDVYYTDDSLSIRLGWAVVSKNDNEYESRVIADGISSSRISNPDNESVYIGLTSTKTYWLCTAGNLDIFGLSCVFPPKPVE